MKALACMLVALCVVGCSTPRPVSDTPYPIPELIDPVTEQPVVTR